MPILQWSNMLSTGVADIDAQHRKIVDLINCLNDAGSAADAHTIEKKVLGELVQYTVYHFGFEEQLMKEHGYADFTVHQQQHGDLIQQVQQRLQQHQQGGESDLMSLMIFLRDWLTTHIMGADRALGAALNAAGVR